MIRIAKLAFLALTVVTFGAAAAESQGQSVAYEAFGTGAYSPITGDYSGTGVGIPLGAHTFYSNVAVTPTVDPLVFDWHSTVPQETIAAGGDKLYFTASGQVRLIQLAIPGTFSAIWTGDFVVIGGTGRFAGARPAAQPLQAVAINDPFKLTDPEWRYIWTLSGRIVLH